MVFSVISIMVSKNHDGNDGGNHDIIMTMTIIVSYYGIVVETSPKSNVFESVFASACSKEYNNMSYLHLFWCVFALYKMLC